ncbi:MAG: peptidyl-tRNA hydrolase, partial [Lachnospiraceae bacterium]|nr:peptidyl-tRNA hydrolase [Lachnospiraceae bacterium]
MKLIVGLGNPEIKYAFTRHNTGFLTIDEIASRYNLSLDNNKFNGIWTKAKIENEDVIVAKPMTYMNNSGEFIRPLADFYKIEPSD